MAEEVIIKFDIGVATNNIARLEAELKKVKQEYKAAEIGSKDFYKAQDAGKQLTEQIKKQNDALKANTNALNGINTSAKFGEKSYGALKQSIKTTKDELLKLDVGSEAFIKTQAELVKLEKQRIDVEKEIPSLFQERIKGAIDESNSVKGLREQIKLYTSAVLAGGEGSAEASKKLAELKDKLDDVQDATKVLKGTGIERLTNSMSTLKEAFANFDADKAKLGFQGIGTAMKAIPIFLILEGIKLLIENFDKIYAFAQSFTDVAKEAKKLAMEQAKLEVATASATRVLSLQVAKQEAAIAVMEAEGKGLKEIEEAENKVRDSKKELIKLRAIELKGAAFAALANNKEIEQNETIEMATYRLVGAISGETNAKAASIIIAKKKAEAEKENNKIIADSMKELSSLQEDIIALDTDAKVTKIKNNKEISDAIRQSNREIRQSQIDLIKDQYDREKEQAIFDADNRIEDLKRNKEFYVKKGELIKNITEKQNQELGQINREAVKHQQDLDNEVSQFKINLIRNDFEKEQEQIKLNEKMALEEAVVTYANNAEQFNKVKQEITAKYAEENRRLALDYVQKDLEAEAEYNVIKSTKYEEQFNARMEQLMLQKQIELENVNLTENERLRIITEYNKKEVELERERVEQKKELRDAEISITASAFTTLNNLAILFSNEQEELAKFSKIGALINIGANTATAISGLIATAFAPDASNLATGGLAAYAKIAAGVVAITSNMLQAKAIVNSFEEGGYTGDGASNEVSTNLGSKPYTYHKSEYVIPARVLGTPQGNMLAAQAESMRLGMSNPMPYIGGMFDGGFTARSAGQDANTTISNNAMLQQLLGNLPTPVVRVTDINKVQGDAIRVTQTSSL